MHGKGREAGAAEEPGSTAGEADIRGYQRLDSPGLPERPVERGRLFLERVEPRVFDKAWGVLMRYYDHGPSYTDCTSVVIAGSISADCAFTFDNHFPIMGVEAQPFV